MSDRDTLELGGSGATAWRLGDLAFDVEAEVERLYASIGAPTFEPLSAGRLAARWLGDRALERVDAAAVAGLGGARSFQLPARGWRVQVSRALSTPHANAAAFDELAYVWLVGRRILPADADEVDRSCEALGRALSLPRAALERLLPERIWRLAWDLKLPARSVALRVVEAFDRTAAVLSPVAPPELRGAANAWNEVPDVAEVAAQPPSGCLRVDLWEDPGDILLIRHPLIIRLDYGSYAS